MKKVLAASALALGFLAGAAQAAPILTGAVQTGTVTYTGGSAAATPTGLTVIQNYDSYANGAALPGTNANVYTMDMGTTAHAPSFNSSGGYAAVTAGGTYTISFAPASAVAFAIGSLDTYNHLTINYVGGTSTLLTGEQIIAGNSTGVTTVPDNGMLMDPTTNGEVYYSVTSGPLISSLTFTSDRNAFEFDNVAAVPEPAAWGMMILGFGLVGGVLRRRPSAKVKFA